jgi:hypothetical protein
MTHDFPYDRALLPRTKLSYANLPGILADGKRDRQARISGYLVIQLGERCYLILIRGGEPFFGALITPQGREPAALSEILRIAAVECERGEGGSIGYYAAGEEQLRAMVSTLSSEPVPLPYGVDTTSAERLFPVLRERAFSGVLELSADDGAHHYLAFRRGAFREGWFAGRDPVVPLADFIRMLFDDVPPRATLFPLVEAVPVHASQGLIEQYRRLLSGTAREMAHSMGMQGASELVSRARLGALDEHPVLAAFEVAGDGRVSGDPVAAPEELTAAVARWITDAVVTAAEDHELDPAEVVARAARDGRFALQEQGFFDRLPWSLAV